jgi:hypothetical protein
MLKKNQVKRKDDLRLIEQMLQRGYMEASGYTWAYPRAAELEDLCRSVMEEK